jgi:glycosyltransferase involved in cell wall biosynthesis
LESLVLRIPGMPNGPLVFDESTACGPAAEAPAARSVDAADAEFTWPSGILFQSPAYGPTSASEQGRAQALALARAGLPVCLLSDDSADDLSPLLSSAVHRQLEQLTHRKLELASSVLYHAAEPPDWNLDYHGRYRVGRAAFWTDRIPARWVGPCNAMDEVWVPSEFHRAAFTACGVDPQKILVLPCGIDTNLFRPGCPQLQISRPHSFNFLSITDLRDHKGMELLLRAFLQEFKADEDVTLILKTLPKKKCPLDLGAELAFFIEKEAGMPLEKSPTILWLEDYLPVSAMPSLYAAADAFVQPVRGASSGQTLLEALACEVPVITTRWGAPLEFLSDENSYLTELEGLSPVHSGDDFLAGHQWANPSLDHLRQLLRKVYSKPDEARMRGQAGRKGIVRDRDWSAVFPRWRQEFQRLLG